jgi:hypothetical protein
VTHRGKLHRISSLTDSAHLRRAGWFPRRDRDDESAVGDRERRRASGRHADGEQRGQGTSG